MSLALRKYYNILGLPETASQNEVKRRYRQLVMKYHPDKNAGNEHKFIQITEAYEVITGKKQLPSNHSTHTYSPTRSTSQARQQSQEERIKQAQQRHRENAYKEHIENLKYFEKLTSGFRWKLINIAAILGAIISFVVLMELFLPYKYEKERIVGYNKSDISSFDGDMLVRKIHTASGKSFYAEIFYSIYNDDPDVLLITSAIFHNSIGVIPFYEDEQRIYKIQYNLGSHSLLLFPLFLFPLFIVLFKKKTHTFTFLYYISLFISTPLVFLYLGTNERWLHLLTLGFA